MKKFLLASVFAVLLLTGCNEEKKPAEQAATPVATEQKATETAPAVTEEKAIPSTTEEKAAEEAPVSTEESKKAE